MATSLQSEAARVVRLADADLRRLWALIRDGAPADEALNDMLPAIVQEYGLLGAAVAADWYDERRVEESARGSFAATPVRADDRGTGALIGWALATAKDDESLRTMILGGVQRRVADHLRLTITGASIQDRGATGWIRVGRGECNWCQQYLDGEVRTVSYDFPAHDHCNCAAEPVFN